MKTLQITEINSIMPTRNFVYLLLAAFFWGTAFVGQAIGVGYVAPFTFTAGRSLIGCLFLIPVIFFLDRFESPVKRARKRQPEVRRNTLIGGIVSGCALFAAESFQQFGLVYTTVGKAGFLTALYIIIVPVLARIRGIRSSGLLWIAVAIAVIALYCLSIKEDFTIGLGELLCFICAFLYSAQIMAIDYYVPKADAVEMSWVMFLTGGVLGLIFTAIFEQGTTLQAVMLALPAMLYVGIFSNGLAYTCQVIGQKGANPAIASLTMSLESVIGALSGWIILGQTLSAREIIGCVLMGIAIVIVQIPQRRV